MYLRQTQHLQVLHQQNSSSVVIEARISACGVMGAEWRRGGGFDACWLSSLSHHIIQNNRKDYKASEFKRFKNNNLILRLPCQANKAQIRMQVSALTALLTCCLPNHQLFSCFKSNFKINQFHLHYTCTESVTMEQKQRCKSRRIDRHPLSEFY